MSEAVQTEVNENTMRLSKAADTLGESIASLKAKVEELSKTIGEEPLPNPNTEIQEAEAVLTEKEETKEDNDAAVDEEEKTGNGEVFGKMELVGGTFAVGGEIHSSLREGINSIFGQGYDGIQGANEGSVESQALTKIGHAAEDIRDSIKNVEESLTGKLTNIQSLKNVMNTTIDKLLDIVKANDSNGTAEANAKIIKDVHDKLNEEFNSQMKSLQTVLNLKLKPTANDLMSLLKDNSKFHVLSERLGVDYNTPEASDRLAMVYTNLSKLQITAKKVEDALKTLEISLDKYKSLKSADELRKVLAEVLKNNTNGKSATALSKVIAAIKTLKSSFGSHGKIIKELKGSMEFEGGDFSTGVGRVKSTNAKSTLKTRVKTYENTVKELFKNFISQVGANFRDIKKSAEAISEKLGSDIVYDDDVKLFISVFEGFNSDLNNGKLFYSLISLDQSMAGKELKTRFMDNLNNLIESLSVLEKYPYLSDVKKQLLYVKENIDTYSDTVLSVRSNEENLKTGKSEFSWSDNLVDPSVPASVSNTIKETITKLKFFGNLSMLKENLNRVSKEYPAMQEGYDKLLGKSIGTKLSELQKEYTEAVDRLNDKERGRGFLLETYNNDPANANDKIPKGLVETIYKLQYEAKVGLYKTVEAIDLYLMKFTEKVSNNVEALKELNTLLSQTELISAWADTSSITNINTLFEMIQPDVDRIIAFNIANEVGVSQTLRARPFVTGESIRKVLEASKKSIESVAVLRNLIAMFSRIGDKFGDSSLSKESYMTSGTMYNNLVKYIWVSAFTMGYGTGGGVGDVEIMGKKDKNGYELEKGDKSYFFDMKMTTCNQPLDLLGEHQKKVMARIDAILATPAFTPAIKQAADNLNEAGKKAAKERYIPVVSDALARAAAAGHGAFLAAFTPIAGNNANEWESLYLCLKELKEELTDKDIFRAEDKYFVLALKSMSAKVLTVVGVSNLLTRPSKVTTMITNPVRSIIGAAESEVVDGAVELYIRLPLLLEFYKNIFDNGNEKYKKNKYANDDSETIAFIPEVGSLWSGLIQCVFDDSKQISNGIYSLENMKRIISEVNKIYKNYSGLDEAKLARTVVLDLISEINRRYGVLKRKEIDEFYQSKKKYTSNMSELSGNANDYDILDAGEEDADIGPSSEFTSSVINMSSNKSKTVSNDIQLVKEFRDLINKELFSQSLDTIGQKSFSERVKMFKHEVKKASSQQAKVEVIIKAIDDSSNINSHNGDIVLLYHELVRYPLSSLQTLYRHQMSALVKIFASIYRTLLINEFDKSPNKFHASVVYLLAARMKMDGDFDVNKANVGIDAVAADPLATIKRNLRYNVLRLSTVNNDITSVNIEDFETANRLGQNYTNDVNAVLAAEVAAANLNNASIINKLGRIVAAQLALETHYGLIQAQYDTVVANPPQSAPHRNALAQIGILEGQTQGLKDAVTTEVYGPTTPQGRDITQGLPINYRRTAIVSADIILNANALNPQVVANIQFISPGNAANLANAQADARLLKTAVIPNNLYVVTNNEFDQVIDPAGADAAAKKVNKFNALSQMFNNAVASGAQFANNMLLGAKIALVRRTGINEATIDRIFPGRDIEDAVASQRATIGSTRVFGKLKRRLVLFRQLQNDLPVDADLTRLVNAVNAINRDPDESDIQANTRLFLEVIKWCKETANVNNNNVNMIEEMIIKTSKFVKTLDNNSNPTSEIHLFSREFLKEIANGKGYLSKDKLLQFFMENFNSCGCSIKFVSSDKYVLDYSKLQTSVEDCLESCKYFLSKMRTQLDNNALILDAEKHINNLEDNYLNKMIYNQDTELTPIFDMLNMEQVNTTLSSIVQSSNLEVDTDSLYSIIVSEKDPLEDLRPSFPTAAVARVIAAPGVQAVRPLPAFPGLSVDNNAFKNMLRETLRTYMNQNRQWVSFENANTPSNPWLINSVFDSKFTSTSNGSILFKFNNLVARYIETFFESSSKKFYINLLSEFSKAQNAAIFGGNGLADCFNSKIYINSNNYLFPNNDAVFSETLGFVIKALTNRQQNKQLQTKYHAQTAISEVSPNMVEKYKAYLPLFINMFEKMLDNCISYKKMLEVIDPADINGNTPDSAVVTPRSVMYGDEDAEQVTLQGSWTQGNAQTYSHLNNILNNIANSLRALINDASVVLKEVDYNPQFFEVKDKSIKNFFSNSGKLPVMPNSILSNNAITVSRFLPHADMDDSKTKLIYGLNYVLNHKNVSNDLNNFLWLKDFVSNYNSSTQKVNNVSLDKLPKYLHSTNSISKMMYEYNFLNKTVSQNSLGLINFDMKFTKTITNAGVATPVIADHLKTNTYYSASNRNINEILSITENSSIENNKKLITDSLVVSGAKTFDRSAARLMNIIDMNVSPINPHALLREIPLINVYNYAFTFDDIVSKDFQFSSADLYVADNNNREFKIVDDRTATAALLLDPYYCVNKVTADDLNVDNSIVITYDAAANGYAYLPNEGHSTNGVLKHALMNALPSSANSKVAFGYPKYIKDIVTSCNDETDLRFNSKFCRNMIFVTNLHRYLLFKIKNEIERVDSKKVTNNHIISEKITSYDDNTGAATDNEFDYLML